MVGVLSDFPAEFLIQPHTALHVPLRVMLETPLTHQSSFLMHRHEGMYWKAGENALLQKWTHSWFCGYKAEPENSAQQGFHHLLLSSAHQAERSCLFSSISGHIQTLELISAYVLMQSCDKLPAILENLWIFCRSFRGGVLLLSVVK